MAKSYVPAALEYHQAHRVLMTRWLTGTQEFSRRDRSYFGYRHDYCYDAARARIKPNSRLIVARTKGAVGH